MSRAVLIKKEIYFRLTKQGISVFKIHEDLHKEFYERDKVVFESISDEEFASMLNFAERYNKHLDSEIKNSDFYIK